MSDKRSPEDRVEERRLSVKNDEIELNFLKTLNKLGLLGPKVVFDNTFASPFFRITTLEITIALDLSGEEWDDDYDLKDG